MASEAEFRSQWSFENSTIPETSERLFEANQPDLKTYHKSVWEAP